MRAGNTLSGSRLLATDVDMNMASRTEFTFVSVYGEPTSDRIHSMPCPPSIPLDTPKIRVVGYYES